MTPEERAKEIAGPRRAEFVPEIAQAIKEAVAEEREACIQDINTHQYRAGEIQCNNNAKMIAAIRSRERGDKS